jgi:hypothetical protein
MPAQVILLWCKRVSFRAGAVCPKGVQGAELLPLVRREGLLTL